MALGEAVPERMLEAMPRETLERWMEFDVIDPFGAQRDDLRSAILGASVCTMLRGKRGAPLKLADFMPDFDKKSRAQTPEEMHAKMVHFAALFGAYNGSH